MALFQKNVLARYVAMQDAQQIDAAYAQFIQYFHDAERQQNILSSKEEQFQEGFLRELFVKILGYTLNPDPAFNLITEKKDVNDSKKADGAILLDGEVIGIIELKDHKTPDLSKVEHQAFGYKNQHPKVRYVVISNFQKLRFYIDNAVEHIEWNLFDLSRDEFAQLWLCLRYDNLSRHLAATVKSESLSSEEQITNKLYKDYIAFKRVLFEDILRRNTTDEGEHSTAEWKILLFKKTQKLLDRLLFIFFAEDSGLLPPNSMREIIKQWRQLVEDLDEDVRLYSRIKKYFGYMNDGHKGKKYEIFAYNGGLFKPDEVLDSLDIDDNLLAAHTLRLSEYDFASEVDVNILGHIFENSLSEIEEVTAQLQNGEAPTVSKRKKDGVFYTPQYITRYIVDNTLGKLCREKREEMELVEEEYYEAQTRQLKTKQRMLDRLTEYRDWLLGLTICDPACGSGAFLNAALQFLMAEHKSLDKMEAALTGSSIEFPNVENSILENNLYGVDINEESVEIARLALWLRTAKPFRKLTSLNGNIKCGNSLISDPEIAGDKAFDWQKEFPQVFEKGGFDVVIGNPPYVHLEKIPETSQALEQVNYQTYNKRGDLYCVFVEKGFQLVKKDGCVSYIMPNKWMQANYGQELRQFFLQQRIDCLIDFGDLQIFDGPTTYPCIFVARKSAPLPELKVSLLSSTNNIDFDRLVSAAEETFDFTTFTDDTWVISSQKEKNLLERLSKDFQTLKNAINGEAYRGVLSGLSEAFLINSETTTLLTNDETAKERLHPFLQGRDLKPYAPIVANSSLILFERGCTHELFSVDNEDSGWEAISEHYPTIAQWLEPFADKGRKRTDKGEYWWELRACDYYPMFAQPKIMYQAFQVKPCFVFDEGCTYCNNSIWFIPTENKALLALLNSHMGWWLITKYCTQIQNGYQLIWKYFGKIPVPNLDDAEDLKALADRMLSLNAELQRLRARFVRRLQENLGLETVSAALQEFDTLTYANFVRELKKQKIKLTLAQQDEWEDYFAKRAAACAALRADIATTDADINARVYTLYGLTEEEIKIVEG